MVSREGLFTKSKDEFVNKYFVKKKDGSLPTGGEEVMVSDTQVQMEEPGSSDVSVQEQQVDFGPIEDQQDIEVQQIQEVPNRTFADRIDQDPFAGQTVDFSGDDSQSTPIKEKDTAIERTFGKNEFTDFFGDIYRAGVQGQTQGATVDESLELMMKGGEASEEDVMDFIQSYRAMQQSGPSDEMNSFNKIYQENGGGVLGFIKGVAANPTVVPQLFYIFCFSHDKPYRAWCCCCRCCWRYTCWWSYWYYWWSNVCCWYYTGISSYIWRVT